MVPTSLAQVVLTLRFVFRSNGLVLIVAEWNRIYAVTNKNRIITSCLSILTISQFSLGLYVTVSAAKAGREFVIRLPPQLLPTSCFSGTDPTRPTSRLYDVHPRVAVFYGSRIYHHVSRIRYGTPLAIHLGDTHPDHLPDVLAFSVIVFLVVRSNVTKIPLPGILKTIVRDATYYFLVIFTSHLITAMFFWFACVSICS